MTEMVPTEIHDYDNQVDNEILKCLDLKQPNSFFLFAGAGSGKTRSLVNVLDEFREKSGEQMQLRGKRVAVITYTNAACEEIERRLSYHPLFSISTIHSFIWELIRGFTKDIRIWLQGKLINDIEELQAKLNKGRSGTKISSERKQSIEIKKMRLENLTDVKHFTYNPNGLNHDKQSLSHSDVIQIGSYFLANKPLMQKILIQKFPILFIDESQDTNKDLLNALFKVEKAYSQSFTLGLFGDTMQRIYSSGKEDLGLELPKRWATPSKKMNLRCPNRVVKLINKIRATVDGKEQISRADKGEGIVRLFISNITSERESAEQKVTRRMEEATGDGCWVQADYTTLILEHHMAARRLGFFDLFEPLYKSKYSEHLLNGALEELNFFTKIIHPLVEAYKRGDQFSIASIMRKYSPMLKIERHQSDQLSRIRKANEAIKKLFALWDESYDPTCLEVLKCVAKHNLFDIPETLAVFIFEGMVPDTPLLEDDNDEETIDVNLSPWATSLKAPFSQVAAYDSYLSGRFNFMTHQGVKGLEFSRVMVIIDDSEARGFLFNYEKLFGADEKTQTDTKNKKEGKETSIDRTRRLFYVTCSRAEESLAIVAYSKNPGAVKENVIREGWFDEEEIIVL